MFTETKFMTQRKQKFESLIFLTGPWWLHHAHGVVSPDQQAYDETHIAYKEYIHLLKHLLQQKSSSYAFSKNPYMGKSAQIKQEQQSNINIPSFG